MYQSTTSTQWVAFPDRRSGPVGIVGSPSAVARPERNGEHPRRVVASFAPFLRTKTDEAALLLI